MNLLKRIAKDTKKYFPYCVFRAKATLKAEIAGSYLNWLWWIINPLCFMMIYWFIFGVVFNSKEPYFPVFIFIGITVWNFFSQTLNHSVNIMKNRKAILNKVYVPKYMFILSDMMANAFKMVISFMIVFVMMAFYKVPLKVTALCIIPALTELLCLTFFCSALAAHIGVFVQDLSNIVSICLRLLMYFTGVFYDVQKRMPAKIGKWVMLVNPVADVMNQIRYGLLYGEMVHMRKILVWIAVSVILSIFSIKLIYDNENNYVKVI